MKRLDLAIGLLLGAVIFPSLSLAQSRAPVTVGPITTQSSGAPTPISPPSVDASRRSDRGVDPLAYPQPMVGQGQATVPAPNGQAVVLTPQVCAAATARAREGATYQPGVDVYGRAVAPADLPNPNSSILGNGAGIVSSTDILTNRPVATGRAGTYGETYVGRVVVDAQGHALMNGRPLDAQPDSLVQLCAQQRF